MAVLDFRTGLDEQVAGMGRELQTIKGSLNSFVAEAGQDQQRINTLKASLVHRHQQLQQSYQQLVQDAKVNNVAGNWTNLLSLRKNCRALAADCLGLEQSILLRLQSPARELCAASDLLLAELSEAVGKPRNHYTLISEAEHFGGSAGAVHLRYAGLDFWSLPRAVHEFGHLWGEESDLEGKNVQKQFVDKIKLNWPEQHGKEFFADVFATYTLGPAYVFAVLIIDFDPAERSVSETHPNGDERAHCVLAALDDMIEWMSPYSKPHALAYAKELRDFWNAARSAAGAGGPLGTRVALGLAVHEVLVRLHAQEPGALYGSISGAFEAKTALEQQQYKPDASRTRRDIVNGAWLARRENDQAASIIGKNALKLALLS